MADAIVFIPGIGREAFGPESLAAGLATRLVAALDRNVRGPREYVARAEALDAGAPFGRIDFARLSVSDSGAQAAVVADLYALDLPALLIEPYSNMSTRRRALNLSRLLFFLAPRLVGVWRQRGKKRGERTEILLGALFFLLLLVSLIGMLFVIVAGLIGGIANFGPFEAISEELIAFAAIVTLAVSNVPPAWKARFNANLVVALVLGNYIASGERRDNATGQLAAFINALDDSAQYSRIHIISYSIGSLVALDALFSRTGPIESLAAVDSLVTIACPADFIQTYWPDYFRGRRRLDAPRQWLNIFEPRDLLASNFIIGDNDARELAEISDGSAIESGGVKFEDGSERRPDLNLRYATVGIRGRQGHLNTATRLHRIYWDPTDAFSASAFDTIVGSLDLQVAG